MQTRGDLKALLEDFHQVSLLAGMPLPPDAVVVQELPAPHKPPTSLPKGKMAVYVYAWRGRCLKVGKAGPNSNARYVSHHYSPGSSKSNLARSLVAAQDKLGLCGISASNVRHWIRANVDRVNLLINADLDMPLLTLLEAFVQCRLKPEFEGVVKSNFKCAQPTDWQTVALPATTTTISLDRAFSQKEMQRIRRGLVPEQMEDKWFIFWKDDALSFHRSWTGFCIYVVRFVKKHGKWCMIEALANRDPSQHDEIDDESDAAMISYLVDVLLLQKEAPFPSAGPSPEELAATIWSKVGRAMFGEHPHSNEKA